MNKIFATCPKGLEELLASELESLGAEKTRLTVAGVFADGSSSFAYKACLWSRIANRILMPLAKFDVENDDDLYQGVKEIPWYLHTTPRESIAVDFSGSNDAIRHTQFGAQRVKDAIVDSLKEHFNDRPDVDLKTPDIRINVRLSKNQANVSLDFSGESLHKRGYRAAMVAAPLKENLAAALLLRAGWLDISSKGGALIDPMCGSGTLLIEAALIAADIAPNLNREKFGFHNWLQHKSHIWEEIRQEAVGRCQAGLTKSLPEIRGYDKDYRAIKAAQENIEAAGLDKYVRVISKPMSAFKVPTHTKIEHGLMICNPPYGERWGDAEELKPLYRSLGDLVKKECPGWKLAVLTSNSDLAGELRLRSNKKYKLFNGAIPSQFLLYQLRSISEREEKPLSTPHVTHNVEMTEGAKMLTNRLRKNFRKLNAWLKQTGVSCYRLYDSDIPEYAVAIDVYEHAIHVQEYAPPSDIEAHQAEKHLSEVRQAITEYLQGSITQVFFKERRRQKGINQYQRQDHQPSNKSIFNITEENAVFEINLTAYLDTGLFLDHRPARRLIYNMAKGSRFLNLFCYTGTASVYAAIGGATSSLSVDMSSGYIDWAERNFMLNGMSSSKHKLLKEDCLSWINQAISTKQEGDQFDLIFLDPPTFSNSKKMDAVLDIQRDHEKLIGSVMSLLAIDGTLIFSNNFRNFSMSEGVKDTYRVEDITDKTFDPDFQRNKKIHNCWLINHHE